MAALSVAALMNCVEPENTSVIHNSAVYTADINKFSGYVIVLVRRLLQYSSSATTQRHIGIGSQRITQATEKHSGLI